MTPEVGDIWKENDPRFERHIVVLGVALERVTIQNVYRAPETIGWKIHGPERSAKIERFNGKRGGYGFVQRTSPQRALNQT